MNDQMAQQFIDRISSLESEIAALKRLEATRKGSGQIVAYTDNVLTPLISSATSWIALMGTALPFTTRVGRRYRFNYIARALSPSGAGGVLGVTIYENTLLPSATAAPMIGDHYFEAEANYNCVNFQIISPGTGVPQNYMPAGIRRNVANITVYSTEFFIEDMGPI